MARYATGQFTAEFFRVTSRTVDNWHNRGYITGYDSGSGSLLFDIDEIESELARRPRTEMRDGRRHGQGRVVIVAAQTEVVGE